MFEALGSFGHILVFNHGDFQSLDPDSLSAIVFDFDGILRIVDVEGQVAGSKYGREMDHSHDGASGFIFPKSKVFHGAHLLAGTQCSSKAILNTSGLFGLVGIQ